MRKLFFLLLPIALCSLVIACQNEVKTPEAKAVDSTKTEKPKEQASTLEGTDITPNSGETAPAQLEYIPHVQTEGTKPKVGEFVFYHLILSADDDVMSDSHSGAPQLAQIPDTSTFKGQLSPLIEGLMRMSKGDSLTVVFPLPVDANRPEKHSQAKSLNYHIAVHDIQTKKEYMERAKAQ